MKAAIIFGVTGQDGSFLSELLLSKGYKVYGVARRTSTPNDTRIRHIKDNNFVLLQGDITDYSSVSGVFTQVLPNQVDRLLPECLEVYNLAAQSHVHVSFNEPIHTSCVVAGGTLNILENIRRLCPWAKYYQAGSSEMFGNARQNMVPCKENKSLYVYMQNENTSFAPQSPYAVAKVAAHHYTQLYRKAYGIFACNGILFNHESERRGENFVTRKITKYVASLRRYIEEKYVQQRMWPIGPLQAKHLLLADSRFGLTGFPKLKLGNLSASRDWGHAADYVYAMWLMLQSETPDDYVIATGETNTVEEFLKTAFEVGIGIYLPEMVEIDDSLKRPAEVGYLCGDASRAQAKLGWIPKVKFSSLVERMIYAELQLEGVQDVEVVGLPKRQVLLPYAQLWETYPLKSTSHTSLDPISKTEICSK